METIKQRQKYDPDQTLCPCSHYLNRTAQQIRFGKTSICPPPPTKTRFKFIQIRNNEYQTYLIDPIQMRTATRNHHLTPKSRNIFQKARVHSYITVSTLFRQ